MVIPVEWLDKKINVAEAEASNPGISDDRVARFPQAAKPFGFPHGEREALKAELKSDESFGHSTGRRSRGNISWVGPGIFPAAFCARTLSAVASSLITVGLHPECALFFSSPPAKADPQWMKRIGGGVCGTVRASRFLVS
jgi:hypothetical protein